MATPLVAGCGGHELTFPERDEPFLYLVLRPNLPEGIFGTRAYAALLTIPSPTEGSWRSAERFEMRRSADHRSFVWRERQVIGPPAITNTNANLLEGNFVMDERRSAEGLGSDSLQLGTRYDLLIETEGVTVRGSATIPAPFTADVVEDESGRLVVVWPSVRGAAGYLVDRELQRDTTYAVPPATASGEVLLIRALDANLYAYMVDGESDRAGIDNGFGVFGAMVGAVVTIP